MDLDTCCLILLLALLIFGYVILLHQSYSTTHLPRIGYYHPLGWSHPPYIPHQPQSGPLSMFPNQPIYRPRSLIHCQDRTSGCPCFHGQHQSQTVQGQQRLPGPALARIIATKNSKRFVASPLHRPRMDWIKCGSRPHQRARQQPIGTPSSRRPARAPQTSNQSRPVRQQPHYSFQNPTGASNLWNLRRSNRPPRADNPTLANHLQSNPTHQQNSSGASFPFNSNQGSSNLTKASFYGIGNCVL